MRGQSNHPKGIERFKGDGFHGIIGNLKTHEMELKAQDNESSANLTDLLTACFVVDGVFTKHDLEYDNTI